MCFCHHMGSLMKSSWIVILTTIGKFVYVQINAAIIATILFNIVKCMHGTVTKSIFLELKYVFISNILTWLHRFTRCNRLGRHN